MAFCWERPNWFAPKGVDPVDDYSFDHPKCAAQVAREHEAVRTRAGIFDQSSFAKFKIEGPDAERELQRICSNDMSRPVGSVVYTQMLNRRGGIEADVTFCRVKDRYYMVTGTGYGLHDSTHLRRNLSPGARVTVSEVTSAYSCLPVMGPASRQILQPLAEADLSNSAFPFATCREIFIAGAPVLAVRVIFVGELGWELHVPSEYTLKVYEEIQRRIGAQFGLAAAGYRAIDSLRLEKAYRVWSADIGPDFTPYEGGSRLCGPYRQERRLHRPRCVGCRPGKVVAATARYPQHRSHRRAARTRNDLPGRQARGGPKPVELAPEQCRHGVED
ncbi:hypothetical protein NKI26_32140 [Mesorhizobium australicum]